MENSKQPINPIQYAVSYDNEKKAYVNAGLTKREYFVGLALQGILANRELQLAFYKDIPIDRERFKTINNFNCLAIHAIDEADRLLEQLELELQNTGA